MDSFYLVEANEATNDNSISWSEYAANHMVLLLRSCWLLKLIICSGILSCVLPWSATLSYLARRNRLTRLAALLPSSLNEFCARDGPYLAVITEESACDSLEQMENTLAVLTKAASTNRIALISIRVKRLPEKENGPKYDLVVALAKQLMQMSEKYGFRVVLSSDWIDAAFEAETHGIHVKEAKWPDILSEIEIHAIATGRTGLLLGTSTHSINSAMKAVQERRPDYLFVGTCYETLSHPEKTILEGPELPGKVCRELDQRMGFSRPKVFAIGGIDEMNCHEPVALGADGVAVIRAISAAVDPAYTSMRIVANMAKNESCF